MYTLYGSDGEGGEPYVVPPWLREPEDEIPVVLPIGAVAARTEGTVVTVPRVEVYSTGTVICADVVMRRREESDRDWSWLMHGRFEHRPGEGDLRWRVELGDGSTAEIGELYRSHPTVDRPPEGWTLTLANGTGGGGGGGELWEQHHGFWLWPLPPAGRLDLVVEWRERGIPESSAALDGDAILDAVARVQPLWA